VHDMILDPKLTGQLPEVISEGGYYGMQTFDQHLLQHLEAGRITMEEAVHVATSPHDFKLMVSAGGRKKGEGQAVNPGARERRPAGDPPEGMPGVATVAPPAPVASPAAAAAEAAPPAVASGYPTAPSVPSTPPPGF